MRKLEGVTVALEEAGEVVWLQAARDRPTKPANPTERITDFILRNSCSVVAIMA
jgi:hypothetical protein